MLLFYFVGFLLTSANASIGIWNVDETGKILSNLLESYSKSDLNYQNLTIHDTTIDSKAKVGDILNELLPKISVPHVVTTTWNFGLKELSSLRILFIESLDVLQVK